MAVEPQQSLLTLPLDALHRELGGRMVPFAGYAMPVQFPAGVMAEHQWTRAQAGLFDVSHMGQLTVGGEDADRWLETLMPGDFAGLARDALRYSLLLNARGGIIDDLMATRRADDFYLVVNGATKHGDLEHMRAALPAGLRLTHRPDWALLALQGPAAAHALDRLVPGVKALTFMRAGGFALDGAPLWISRSGYTGEDGFEISLPADAAEAVARRLLAQPEVKPVGLGARDSLRLEAGLPLYGHDLTQDTTPAQAGLAFAVSKRRRPEGGFPGAATVLAELRDGPPRRRVGMRLEGRQPAREGSAIFAGDALAGAVTSGGFAPSVNGPVAMGYVAAAHALEGAALEIEVRGKRLGATVVPMPFWRKSYVR